MYNRACYTVLLDCSCIRFSCTDRWCAYLTVSAAAAVGLPGRPACSVYARTARAGTSSDSKRRCYGPLRRCAGGRRRAKGGSERGLNAAALSIRRPNPASQFDGAKKCRKLYCCRHNRGTRRTLWSTAFNRLTVQKTSCLSIWMLSMSIRLSVDGYRRCGGYTCTLMCVVYRLCCCRCCCCCRAINCGDGVHP